MAEQSETERHGKTLFIRNLPYNATNEKLEEIFSDIGPIKKCFVVKDKESETCRGFGYVQYTLFEDAAKAINTIKKVDGRKVQIFYADRKEKKKRFGQPRGDAQTEDKQPEENLSNEEKPLAKPKEVKSWIKFKKDPFVQPKKGERQPVNPMTEGKRARLIIRNLSFKCTDADLKKAFEKYGKIVDVNIPMKGPGIKLGCGFVQFENKVQAGMAIKGMNGNSLKGRVVAVDWTLPKNKFLASRPVKDDVKDESGDQESMEVEADKSNKNATLSQLNNRKRKHTDVGKGKAGNESSDDEDGSTEDDGSNDSDDDETSDEEEDASSDDDEDASSDDDEDVSSDDDEGSDGSVDDDSDEDGGKKKKIPERESDVTEGRTVFIRNLPFNTDNEALEEVFSQFGDLNYGRVVMDRLTGMPRGTGFVQFSTQESAEECIAAAADTEKGGISVGGRQLHVSLAVSRQQAGQLIKKKEEKKEQKDSRNLYLAREGLIREGTQDAKDVPPADMEMRNRISAANRAKLKDQNIFVSSTRLCVHNIPPTVTDSQLRVILIRAVGDRSAKLTECRIMRDLNRLNSEGVGKSRGYAFCSFTQHEHALKALKHLNNNSEIFGDKKRPIVEFSLENRKALEIKQKRIERSQAKCKQIEENSRTPGRKSQGASGKSPGTQTGKWPGTQAGKSPGTQAGKWPGTQAGKWSGTQGGKWPRTQAGKSPGTEGVKSPGPANEVKKKWTKHDKKKQWKDTRPLDTMKSQDKVARSLHTGPLGLPSHFGPKQRHKKRPADQGRELNTKGSKKFKMEPKKSPLQGKNKAPKMKTFKKRKDFDDFDRMVANYKQKIIAGFKT